MAFGQNFLQTTWRYWMGQPTRTNEEIRAADQAAGLDQTAEIEAAARAEAELRNRLALNSVAAIDGMNCEQLMAEMNSISNQIAIAQATQNFTRAGQLQTRLADLGQAHTARCPQKVDNTKIIAAGAGVLLVLGIGAYLYFRS